MSIIHHKPQTDTPKPKCPPPAPRSSQPRVSDYILSSDLQYLEQEGEKEDTANPKDRVGQTKINLFAFPPAGLIHGAHAMMDGAQKYGAYNWREKDVLASIYVAAAMRHISSWLDREEEAQDSGVHHLGHALACMAILLDAQETGCLIDDRPIKGSAAGLLARLNEKVLTRAAARELMG